MYGLEDKVAIVTLTRSLAQEVAPFGITVNTGQAYNLTGGRELT